jgi:hypothetical protein
MPCVQTPHQRFNSFAASAAVFETTQADGTPVLAVNRGGPAGHVAGLAPKSAATALRF